MKFYRFLFLLCNAFVVVMLAAPLATAQDEKSEITVKKDAVNAPAPRVSEAHYIRELAINGHETKDPYLLIQAAQLAITSGKIPSLKAQVKTPGQAPEKTINVDPAVLLKEAAQMAGDSGDRQAIQIAAEVARNKIAGLGNDALADEISKTNVARGLAKGQSLEGSGCLHSGEAIYWEAEFRKHENAEVVVASDPNPLVLVLGDEKNGGVVKYDEYTLRKTAAWYMDKGGKVAIALAASFGDTCYAIYIP